jgi:hypothetical protein
MPGSLNSGELVPSVSIAVLGRTHVSPTISRPRAERCRSPVSALAMCSMDTNVREVAAGRIPARPAHGVVHAVRVTLFAQVWQFSTPWEVGH